MNLKQRSVSFILVILIVCAAYSCKKNNNTTVVPTTIYTNLDSIVGYYVGVTSGDSLYSYTDSVTGQVKQWVHSFSWPDTITVSTPDTASILVTSKFYTATFPYGDSLTFVSINATTGAVYTTTGLQTVLNGQINSFNDTTGGYDHLLIQSATTYTKSVNSNVTLYSR